MDVTGILAVKMVAASIAVLTAPLLAELVLSVFGNLRHFNTPRKNLVRDVRLAVVVPAQQQEETIAQTVQALLDAGCSETFSRRLDRVNFDRADGGAWEIPAIVTAYNCTDSTAAVAAGYGAKVVAFSEDGSSARDRALRLGFEAAEGLGANAFLVVDPASAFTPNLIAATLGALAAGATATQARIELLRASGDSVNPIARLREIVFRGNNAMGPRGRAGLGFSAGLLADGFALTAGVLQKVPFLESHPGGIEEYHRQLIAAGFSVRWIDHAIIYCSQGQFSVSELPQDLKSAIAAVKLALRSFGRLIVALAHGRWRALEPLTRSLSLPFSFGAALLLTAARLPLVGCQIAAAVSALLCIIFAIEAIVLGGSVRRNLRALGGAPGHPIRSAAQSGEAPLSLRKNPVLDAVRREVRLP